MKTLFISRPAELKRTQWNVRGALGARVWPQQHAAPPTPQSTPQTHTHLPGLFPPEHPQPRPGARCSQGGGPQRGRRAPEKWCSVPRSAEWGRGG